MKGCFILRITLFSVSVCTISFYKIIFIVDNICLELEFGYKTYFSNNNILF